MCRELIGRTGEFPAQMASNAEKLFDDVIMYTGVKAIWVSGRRVHWYCCFLNVWDIDPVILVVKVQRVKYIYISRTNKTNVIHGRNIIPLISE